MNSLRYLQPARLPRAHANLNFLAQQREIILQRLLNLLLALYTVGLPLILIVSPQVIRSGHVEYYLIGYACMAAIAFARGLPNTLRAMVVIVLLQILGLLALRSYGLSGTGPLFLLGAAVISGILLPRKFGPWMIAISLLLLAGAGVLMISGRIPLPPASVLANSGQPAAWFVAGAVFIFLSVMIVVSLQTVTTGLSSALEEKETLTRELSQHQQHLEQRIEERSAEVKNRLAQFEIASRIAQQISSEVRLDALLNNSVQLIREAFDFSHAGVFLVDERGEYAVLRAATGAAGRQMLERDHRLKIGESGIVGYVTHRGEARIAGDVREDITFAPNPLLPETRSEMALPMRVGGKTIGALDVQSVLPAAFTQEDVQILQIIADQLAVAFQKNRLVEELRRAVDEAETSQRISIQKAWRAHLRSTRRRLAYRYRNARLEEHAGSNSEIVREALATAKVVVKSPPNAQTHEQSGSLLAVPIKMRNQVLGVVDLKLDSAQVSPEFIALIEGAASRLAVSLENARLLEEIQFRAERERMVNEISTKVRAASDVDTVLQVAIQEIGQSLGVSEVAVRLRKDA